MKKIFALLLVAGICQSSMSWAVDPTPRSERQEKVESIQSSGALKVEKKPAVSPEALRKADETAPPPRAEKPIAPSADGGAEHLFGLHAALGFPHVGSVGLNYVHPSHYFSAELSTGAFSVTLSDIKTKIQNNEVALRWHPWAGSFYLGALLGNQKITSEKTEVVSGQSATGKAEVKSNYLTPVFGWMWGGQSSGFFTSMEFGYQSPSSVKTSFSSDADPAVQATQDYRDLENDVTTKAHDYGNMGLPHVVLLKIGWLF